MITREQYMKSNKERRKTILKTLKLTEKQFLSGILIKAPHVNGKPEVKKTPSITLPKVYHWMGERDEENNTITFGCKEFNLAQLRQALEVIRFDYERNIKIYVDRYDHVFPDDPAYQKVEITEAILIEMIEVLERYGS